MIVNVKADLCICSSWDLNDDGFRHGVSGHIFEIVEYFYILKNKYHTKILLGDPRMTRDVVEDIIRYKYNFHESDIIEILDAIIYCKVPPKHVLGNTALFVDGCLVKMQPQGIKLHFDKIYTFKCSRYEPVYDLQAYRDVIPLLDYRVYKDINQEDVNIGIDYKKRVLIDRLRRVNGPNIDTALLYLTKNCRLQPVEYVQDIFETYNFSRYLIVTDTDDYDHMTSSAVKVLRPPVDSLFELFDTYIYTPISLVWDGSPRLPVECAVFDKNVIYHDIGEEYLSRDRGLYYRRHDINDSLTSLYLTEQDDILNII